MGRKVHVVGKTDDGRGFLLKECDENENASKDILVCEPVVSGQPILPGQQIAMFKKSEDEHLEYDVLVDGDTVEGDLHGAGGPIQVATKAYRDGWDRIFGNKSNVN